jgi:CBS domain-containing protein
LTVATLDAPNPRCRGASLRHAAAAGLKIVEGRGIRPGPLVLPSRGSRLRHDIAGTDRRDPCPHKIKPLPGVLLMLARDLMATDVATIAPNAPLHVVTETMIERGVTGLPVVDATTRLLGLVTESDVLHRMAAVEQVRHGYLWGIFHSPRHQADEYARSHGRLAADVMTMAEDMATATEDTTAEHLAKVMEERRIRHIPILGAENLLVGMVTRTHLLRAALQLPEYRDTEAPDSVIRRDIIHAMREQPWADTHFTFVDVQDGVVTFSGFVSNDHIKRGLRAVAEEVQGVRDVVFLTQPTPAYLLGAS